MSDEAMQQGSHQQGNAEREVAEKATAKQIEKLMERAKKRRDPWLPIFQEVYDYVFPYRDSFFGNSEGQSRTDDIFDQTAVVGTPQFASRIQHGIFPPTSNAFGLAPGVDFPEKKRNRDLQMQLNVIADAFHEGIRTSNFENELHEGLQDLGIGTMTLLCEEGVFPGEMKFTAVPHNNLFLLPGASDYVGTWIYERPGMTLQEVRDTWPRANVNEKMAQAARNNPDTKVRIWQVTSEDPDSLFEPRYRYFLYCPDYQCVLDQKEYRGLGSCPWITARWSKTSTEVWGRGPLLQVLPSIKTCNLVVQYVLENADMAISGMYAYDDDGVFNPDNVRIEPGMFVPKQPGSKIEPLTSPARFDVSSLVLEDERRNIRKGLFIDELDREAKTPLSAEEVSQRMANTARNMGSVSGRLWNELVVRLVQRMAYLYRKQGIIELPKIDGKTVRMVPLSPLLRVQDQADISNFVNYVTVMNGTMGQGSSGIALNSERTKEWLSRKFGMPLELLNSEAEIEKLVQGAANAAQAVPEMAPDMAKAAIGGALKTF
jgi:hypothetical protein